MVSIPAISLHQKRTEFQIYKWKFEILTRCNLPCWYESWTASRSANAIDSAIVLCQINIFWYIQSAFVFYNSYCNNNSLDASCFRRYSFRNNIVSSGVKSYIYLFSAAQWTFTSCIAHSVFWWHLMETMDILITLRIIT